MTKTFRNRLIVAAGLIAAATSAPALAATFMGENFSCDSAAEDLNSIFEEHQAPQSAGAIPMMRHLIWMLESAIRSMDANCQGEAGYYETRQSFVNSLNSTKRACAQMSSSGYCSGLQYNRGSGW